MFYKLDIRKGRQRFKKIQTHQHGELEINYNVTAKYYIHKLHLRFLLKISKLGFVHSIDL